MDIEDVRALLPHEPPILMLDRVVEIDPGVSGVGERLFQPGDACFAGHFPWQPLLPGVLMIEALAQTTLVVMLAAHRALVEPAGPDMPLGYLARIKEMSFQRPIEPGQEARFAVQVVERLGQFTIVKGRVTSDGKLCAKGRLAVAVDRRELEAAIERRRAERPSAEEG